MKVSEAVEQLVAEVGDGIVRGEEGEEWGDLAQVSAAAVRTLLASHEALRLAGENLLMRAAFTEGSEPFDEDLCALSRAVEEASK